jgi:hypothetical protein
VAHEIGSFINELRAAKDLSELIQVHPGLWPFINFFAELTKNPLLFAATQA